MTDEVKERERDGGLVPVSALLAWIEECWPEGSGSAFNQGVVRGFEIIKAQLEQGHIQRFALTIAEKADATCCRPGCTEPVREVLDGEPLCQEHCNEWVRGEGMAEREREQEEAEIAHDEVAALGGQGER